MEFNLRKMRKLLVFICMVVVFSDFLFFDSFTYAEEQQEAADLTKSTVMTISGNQDPAFLKDFNAATKRTLPGNTTIALKNEQGIKGIYIIWEKVPGEWQLEVNDKTFVYGKSEFIHEYISIVEINYNTITIHIPDAGATIADISIFSEGKIPSWVQIWDPPCKEADMMLIPTHADDEHIFFGGTMPYYGGELGLKVQVVYLTNHWEEYYRPHELLNGLWEVGITAYPVIGPFTDRYSSSLEHAKTLYPPDSVIEFHVEMIRRFKPKVIIAHDFNGEYGHGVHQLNTYALSEALEKSNKISEYPDSSSQYGIWDVPKTYVHLYEENQIVMNWDIPLDSFDGITGFVKAEQGFAKHRSQQGFFHVGREGVYNCMQFGLYRSTVGQDIKKNDFFENIRVYRSYTYNRRADFVPYDTNKKETDGNKGAVYSRETGNGAENMAK